MGISFYKGVYPIEGNYVSDLPCHILISQHIKYNELPTNNICSFVPPYKLFHIFVAASSYLTNRNYELASVLVLVLTQIILYLLMLYYYKKIFKPKKINLSDLLIIFSLIIISSLPFKNGNLYLPQGGPNIWHNPTYIFLRPFSLVSFFNFYLLSKNENDAKSINFIIFSIATLLSTYSKPSFSLPFLFASGILVAISLFKNKFKNIKYGIKMFVSVLPTLVLMFYQYLSVNNFGALNTSIKFGTFLNLSFSDSIIASFCSLLYPIISSIYILKHEKNTKYLQIVSWSYMIVSWLQYYFLYQTSFNNGDYAWGYFAALFFIYYINTITLLSNGLFKKIKTIYILFIIQTVFGTIYFFIYLFNLDFMANILYYIKYYTKLLQ
ncbi:MAG: hypothetical protein WBH68_01765 [Erysipelotrichaceae bacterium]|nr:hypothetical protein [Bacillota bacterium]